MNIEQPFKDFLYDYFQGWEKKQPKRRSSFSAFARWLSENSMEVEVKQQNVDAWMNGTIPKDHKYVLVLAEKIGDVIYDVLKYPRSNLYLQRANRAWEFLPEDRQKQIAEEAEQYEAQNEVHRVAKNSKRRKTSTP